MFHDLLRLMSLLLITLILLISAFVLTGCVEPVTLKLKSPVVPINQTNQSEPTPTTANSVSVANNQPEPTSSTNTVPVEDSTEIIKDKTSDIYSIIAKLSDSMYGGSWPRSAGQIAKTREIEGRLIKESFGLVNLIWNNENTLTNEPYLAEMTVSVLRQARSSLISLGGYLDDRFNENNGWESLDHPSSKGKAVEVVGKPADVSALLKEAGMIKLSSDNSYNYESVIVILIKIYDEAEKSIYALMGDDRFANRFENYLEVALKGSTANVCAMLLKELAMLSEFDSLPEYLQARVKKIGQSVESFRLIVRNYEDKTGAELRNQLRNFAEIFRWRYLTNQK